VEKGANATKEVVNAPEEVQGRIMERVEKKVSYYRIATNRPNKHTDGTTCPSWFPMLLLMSH